MFICLPNTVIFVICFVDNTFVLFNYLLQILQHMIGSHDGVLVNLFYILRRRERGG